jgi:hypothetical protein
MYSGAGFAFTFTCLSKITHRPAAAMRFRPTFSYSRCGGA